MSSDETSNVNESEDDDEDIGPDKQNSSNDESEEKKQKKRNEDFELLRAKTMYGMVQEKDTSYGKKKLVFFTNRQAREFNSDNIHVLLDKLDLGKPKLVIIPMYSTSGKYWIRYGVPTELKADNVENWRDFIHQNGARKIPYKDEKAASDAAIAVETFMRDILVPLAADTGAIVLLTARADCSLGMAFCKAAHDMKAKYGGKVPFTTLAFAGAVWLHGRINAIKNPKHEKTNKPEHIDFAYQLYSKSETWKQQTKTINRAIKHLKGKKKKQKKKSEKLKYKNGTEKKPPEEVFDLNPYVDNFVIVDAVGKKENKNENDKETIDDDPLNMMEHNVLQYLTRKIPSLALRSYQCGQSSMPKQEMLSLLLMKVPILLLDCRNRKHFRDTLWDENYYHELFEKVELINNDVSNMTEEQKRKFKANQCLREWERSWVISKAIEYDKKMIFDLHKKGSPDCLDIARLAFFRTLLYADVFHETRVDRNDKKNEQNNLALHECINNSYNSNDTNYSGNLPLSQSQENDLKIIVEHLVRADAVSRCDKTKDEENKDAIATGEHEKADARRNENGQVECENEEDKKPVCKDNCNCTYCSNKILDEDRFEEEYMLNDAMLRKENLYSVNILNISWGSCSDLANYVRRLARLNYVPDKNTYEANILICDAWNIHDISTYNLRSYKFIAKSLYSLQLFFGFAIVIFSSVFASDDWVSLAGLNFTLDSVQIFDKVEQHFLFSFTLVLAFLSAIQSFVEPGLKWRSLRSECLRLESEIWKFRTRTGQYEVDPSESRREEYRFARVIENARQNILIKGGIKTTAFNKEYPIHVFKHGQKKPQEGSFYQLFCGATKDENDLREKTERKEREISLKKKGFEKFLHNYIVEPFNSKGDNIFKQFKNLWGNGCRSSSKVAPNTDNDNHASPLEPKDYINKRLKPVLEFYQSRLPRYSNIHRICQYSLIVTNLLAALLVYLSFSKYVVCLTSFGGSIGSWLAYNDTEKKIQRYNECISQIQALELKWHAFTQIEKAVMENISGMIESGESIINNERSAWLSSAEKSQSKAVDEFSKRNKFE